uniref:Uncharacterized protein n=1 Tax=Gasterosteus aculeatus TaxID=69293 RepID=G3QCL1_GASAC
VQVVREPHPGYLHTSTRDPEPSTLPAWASYQASPTPPPSGSSSGSPHRAPLRRLRSGDPLGSPVLLHHLLHQTDGSDQNRAAGVRAAAPGPPARLPAAPLPSGRLLLPAGGAAPAAADRCGGGLSAGRVRSAGTRAAERRAGRRLCVGPGPARLLPSGLQRSLQLRARLQRRPVGGASPQPLRGLVSVPPAAGCAASLSLLSSPVRSSPPIFSCGSSDVTSLFSATPMYTSAAGSDLCTPRRLQQPTRLPPQVPSPAATRLSSECRCFPTASTASLFPTRALT